MVTLRQVLAVINNDSTKVDVWGRYAGTYNAAPIDEYEHADIMDAEVTYISAVGADFMHITVDVEVDTASDAEY